MCEHRREHREPASRSIKVEERERALRRWIHRNRKHVEIEVEVKDKAELEVETEIEIEKQAKDLSLECRVDGSRQICEAGELLPNAQRLEVKCAAHVSSRLFEAIQLYSKCHAPLSASKATYQHQEEAPPC